jgi:hypothetical protein
MADDKPAGAVRVEDFVWTPESIAAVEAWRQRVLARIRGVAAEPDTMVVEDILRQMPPRR